MEVNKLYIIQTAAREYLELIGLLSFDILLVVLVCYVIKKLKTK